MTTGDVLRAAAKRVRQGWCQGSLCDVRGSVCALGALSVAVGVPIRGSATDAQIDLIRPAVAAIYDALDIAYRDVTRWNDYPGQTAEDVAIGLERAADYWESQQTPAIVWTMREGVIA